MEYLLEYFVSFPVTPSFRVTSVAAAGVKTVFAVADSFTVQAKGDASERIQYICRRSASPVYACTNLMLG